MPDSPDAKLAVLIDADNVQPGIADDLLAEIAKYGVASVKRAYGDWTSDRLKGWKAALPKHAIRPVQQFANTAGKNATDSAMIIDAMDLLYTSRFDGFCIVSSDSDFTGLASRLREAAVTVYGFGERKTPESLRAACDRFIYLELLGAQGEPDSQRAPEAATQPDRALTPRRIPEGDARLEKLIRAAIDAQPGDGGWVHLGGVGSYINKQDTAFDPRIWGHKRLVELVRAMSAFEVKQDSQRVLIRERPAPPKKAAPKKAAKKQAVSPRKAAPAKKA